MDDTMKVMDLLEELEDMVDVAKNLPLTSKVMVNAGDIFNIVREIRLALPNDVQQAKWIKDERDNILADARVEYERIIKEAQKQADYLVETDNITVRANELANRIKLDAENQSKMTMIKSYEYVDRMLYEMEQNVDFFNMKVFGEMYSEMEKKMNEINDTLAENRHEIKELALKTKNGADYDEYDEYDDDDLK